MEGSTWRDVPDPFPPPTATEEQIERDARRFDETVSDDLERQAQDSTDPMHAAMLRVIARAFGGAAPARKDMKMGMLDELKALREKRAALAACEWCCSGPTPRIFTDEGGYSREHDLDQAFVRSAVCVTENGSGGAITYSGSRVVGEAVKSCVLRYLDKRIASIVAAAKAEYEAACEATEGASDE